MTALNVEGLALTEEGPSVTMSINPGQTLCVVGPAASGKSGLLRALAGVDPPARGVVDRPSRILIPAPCNRKLRPQDISHKRGANRALHATEVLSHLGLWNVRQQCIADLSTARIAACDLVETFMEGPGLIVLDECLDRLDPWVRGETLKLIRDRCGLGSICVAATNQLDLASQFDWLILMSDQRPVYAGSVAELAAKRGQRSMTIESERHVGVRALVEPLLVGVTRTESGYRLVPGPGQEQAARLLRDGYGDVKFVVSDEKTLAEIILGML